MPLPLGHTVVGYSFAAATGIRFRRDTWTAILFSLVVANLPDADFLPGALADEPGIYHRTIAHTLPAALLCGLIIGAVLTRFGRRFWEITFLGTLVYSSHLFADMVNFGAGNIGVQILWPFDHGWYNIPTPLAGTDGGPLVFHRGADSEGFFASFATWQFFRSMLLQALLFTPLLPIGWLIRWKRSAASR
jgi:membrane-bound metal-dependent hydrolase YbcI (DUF457 family)